MPPNFTVPGMKPDDAAKVIDHLQARLVTLIDLQLTLKHIHWNVVGPAFIGVHEMLDPQVDAVRGDGRRDGRADRHPRRRAQRPAREPRRARSWDDYDLGRAMTQEHLGALDIVYDGVITEHRQLIDELEELDQVTQDMVIGQSEKLEQFQWFVRAHLESNGGRLVTTGATTERQAAAKAGGRTSTGGAARHTKKSASSTKAAKSTGATDGAAPAGDSNRAQEGADRDHVSASRAGRRSRDPRPSHRVEQTDEHEGDGRPEELHHDEHRRRGGLDPGEGVGERAGARRMIATHAILLILPSNEFATGSLFALRGRPARRTLCRETRPSARETQEL